MKMHILFILLVASVFGSGCFSSGTSRGMTAKEMADRLEAFPLGTPVVTMAEQFPEMRSEAKGGRMISFDIYRLVAINPTEPSDIVLYRQ